MLYNRVYIPHTHSHIARARVCVGACVWWLRARVCVCESMEGRHTATETLRVSPAKEIHTTLW